MVVEGNGSGASQTQRGEHHIGGGKTHAHKPTTSPWAQYTANGLATPRIESGLRLPVNDTLPRLCTGRCDSFHNRCKKFLPPFALNGRTANGGYAGQPRAFARFRSALFAACGLVRIDFSRAGGADASARRALA